MDFQMYFLSENMSFLRIVQIIDIKAKKFDGFGYSFRPSEKPSKTIKEQAFFRPSGTGWRKDTKQRPLFPPNNKKHMLRHDVAADIDTSEKN